MVASSEGFVQIGHGERRQQLTVMFCDLVGSTRLSQRLDPEELRELKQAFIKACAGPVERYDGHLAQVWGDGLLIYFGWPSAHEDDAERCVRSALNIVDAVTRERNVEPLAVRIGVATGPVVVGGAAGGSEAGLAVGEAPNLAQRLQTLAKPNEILIAHGTRTLLGASFELTDLGSLAVKDYPAARAWRVEAERQAAGRFDAAHAGGPLSPFVGRADELDVLMRAWQSAQAGNGRAVLIGGEAGIGKSRLTEVLRERIADQPHTTLRYQCSRFHQDVALHPIIARLEFAAGFARDDTPDQKLDKLNAVLVGSAGQRHESAYLLGALLSVPTDRLAPPELSAQKQREKTLAALLDQVEALSQIQPLLMVVEDAHWIDPTSQELLDALAMRLPALRLLLVVTYRPLRPHEYAPSWGQSSFGSTLTLSGLPVEQSQRLAASVAGVKALPDAVLAQIIVRADGLPLYIEELTKSMLESPQLLEEAHRYTLLEPVPALSIPRTLEALLIERMGRREGMSKLAQIGAFIGRVFSYELLAALAAKEVESFDDELEELTRTELVFRRGTPPDATYTFKHALVQDAAYNSVPIRKRPGMHARIADLLEAQPAESGAGVPELLAYHRTEAGQLLAAIPLWRRAGESALARVALQEAVNHLEKGLAIIERLTPSSERDRLELSLREPLHSARLRWRGWAAAEVGANAMAILWLAQRQHQPQSLLIGLWGMWINTITQGRVAEAPPWATRLLVEGTDGGDLDMQIFGYRALLSSHFYLGELQKALEQRERILALYDVTRASRWMELTGNDTRTAVGVFGSQSLWMLGYPDQAVALSDQKDADARRLGHPFDIGWALTWGAYVFDYRCEPDRLLACAGEADRLGREQSIPVLTNVLVPMVSGLARLRKGELSQAISLLRTGIEGWSAGGGHLNLPYLKAALAEALVRAGALDDGLRILDECLEQMERPGWHERVWLPEVLRLKGWVLLRMGEHAKAEAQLRASIEWARRQRAKSWELRSAITLAELLNADSRRDAARELLAPVYAWFTEGFGTRDLAAANALLATLG